MSERQIFLLWKKKTKERAENRILEINKKFNSKNRSLLYSAEGIIKSDY